MSIAAPVRVARGPQGGRPRWVYLHKSQSEVFNSPARFKTVVAGRRWGKTQLAKIEIKKEARKKKRLIWYIAPTYLMARQIMWNDLLDTLPKKWVKKPNESRLEITLKNGSIIALKGADKPDTLRGVGLHLVILDEFQDMRPETWDTVIQPTLASTQGRAIFIGTPKAYNHLYDHYMNGQNSEYSTWSSWQFKTLDSPFILPEEIEQARRNMSEKEFKQEFEASFEVMSNRVYHAFDRNVHVKRVKPDFSKPILIGMDFNLDPMSAVLFQHTDDKKIRVFDEITLRSSHTQEMAEEIERRYWRYKKKIIIYPDPAGTQGSTQSRGESDISILRGKGFKRLRYRKKHPRVRDRVNSVNRMLRAADGSINMEIDFSCREFIKSLEQTQYRKGTNDIDKKPGVEHHTDGFGYACEIEHPCRTVQVLGVSI